MKRRSAMRALVLGLIIILGCNFPFQAARTVPLEEFQATLTALAPEDEQQIPATPSPEEGNPTSQAEGQQPATTSEPESSQVKPPELSIDGDVFIYFTQPGDTLPAVAGRFAVEPEQVSAQQALPPEAWLPVGQALRIPNQVGEVSHADLLLPNSEIIYSPATVDFNVQDFVSAAGGYLATYSEAVKGNQMSGVEIVEKVARENSINPRILLALLEYRSGWVYGQAEGSTPDPYPIGFYVPDYRGLYYELVLTATHLGVGYYGWRSGSLTIFAFADGGTMRVNPGLNPGSVALQVLLAKITKRSEWEHALYDPGEFLALYQRMYGDPWQLAVPLIPPDLSQPRLELPFAVGERWSFTGGPHLSWNSGSARGAIDFSPVTGGSICGTSSAWVRSSAAGVVTRSDANVVAVDLDGDGKEQTGWVVVYLHIAEGGNIAAGIRVDESQALGHPSCERGNATGTNVHLARKYNGEWLPAVGAVPFVLSGWQVQAGEKSYQGQLVKEGRVVVANPGGPSSSVIVREE